ncbi:MAG: TonB-dependent receptor [Halospina sp.]
MKRQSILPLAAAITLSTSISTAQETDLTTQTAAFNMDPLVVTSTLGVETVEESLSSVTVIDSETLERQQPSELSDVLRAQPGINVKTNGSFGKATDVYTRGTNSESTVLLMDGIRIRSATTGGAPWQFIPPELLNRVEIVRGPRGSLYGADAAGGVIQGFTLPHEGEGSTWVEAGGGNFSTREGGAGVSGSVGNTRYSIQGNHVDTEGASVRPGTKDLGFRNAAASASVEHKFDNGARLTLLGMHSRGKTEYLGGYTDFAIQTMGLKADVPVSELWNTSVQLSESRDEQEQGSGSFYDTRTRTARWENSLDLGRHEWILGAEFYSDEVATSSGYTEKRRNNTSAFTQLLSDYGRFDTQMSIRWDDNEAFGEEGTGSIAFGYELDSNHRIRASYGTAFRAPTFNDLYAPYSEDTFAGVTYKSEGDPETLPETSATVELGVGGHYEHTFWDLAVYETNADDLIQNQLDDDGVSRPNNVEEARIRGAELSSGFIAGNWELQSAFTLQDPRNRSADPNVHGNRLSNRTVQSMRVDADYSEGPYNVGASWIVEGDRYDNASNTEKLPGYAIANLRLGVALTERLQTRFTIENAFDRRYETDRGYRAAGRTAMASIRYEVQ